MQISLYGRIGKADLGLNEKKLLSDQTVVYADETNRIQEEMILSFAEITENKSGQTGQHIKRVSEYSRIIATQLGLNPDLVESIRIASTMHDVADSV